jgi:uncharacterized protein (DUF1501 family)
MNRRIFIKGGLSSASTVAFGDLFAQTSSDYKALVCIFLAGGNDSFNTVLATDENSWTAYQSVRNQLPSSIALKRAGVSADLSAPVGSPEWLGGVNPLSPAIGVSGRSFAVHPRLKQVARLFNTDRRIAIVSNVGPLIQPTTKSQYLAQSRGVSVGLKLPKKLFSHNDQQNTWQAMSPEGALYGWGGLVLDQLAGGGASPHLFSSISVSGNAVWLSGIKAKQYQLGLSGAIATGGSTVYGSSRVADALKRIASNNLAGTGASGVPRAQHAMMMDVGGVSQRSINAEGQISSALAAFPTNAAPIGPDSRLSYTNLNGVVSTNSLALQLQAIARTIAARSALGVGRQIFFAQIGGFDTHDGQNASHAELLSRLDHALSYFDETLGLMGMREKVTTFTASDFGRTFTSNGDGTDHGWGGHQFVMGGAVKGGKIYGAFPKYAVKNGSNNDFDGSDDLLANGVMLPSTSVDQFGATIANWFGVSDTTSIFPHLSQFSSRNIGFL